MSKKLLIIEDDNTIRENVVEFLELSGFDVLSASNGIEGVRIARENIPDLIVCDIMMPEMDGYGVLYTLAKDDNLAHIPFIFLTAKAGTEDFRKGMRFGADDYIVKPFEASELLSSIETRLRKSKLLKDKYSADYSGLQDLVADAKNVLQIDDILKHTNTIKGKKRDGIYREGANPKEIFYLKAGKVKKIRLNEDGKELITEVWQKGDFFDTISALNETPYTHSAVAIEDYEIITIPLTDFKKLLKTNTEVASRYIKILAGNVESRETELLAIAYGNVRSRLAEALIKLADTYTDSSETGIPLSREELAQYIGVALETLIRTVSDFKNEGLITMQKTKIVPNIQKLKSMKY